MNYVEDMQRTAQTLASSESEAAVVSILLNFPAANDECEKLLPEHFAGSELRALFAEIRKQHAKGAYDVVTIAHAVSGALTVQEVHAHSTYHDHTPRAISRHVQTVIEASKGRKLFEVGQLIHSLSYEQSPIQTRIDRAASALMSLEDKGYGEWISAHESAIKHIDVIEDRESGKRIGMESGIGCLDRALGGGFQRGNYVVIGARPAMGKSALALTIGLHMAKQYSVGFISMEMSRIDIADRQAAILGRVPLGHVKQPKKGLEYNRIVDAVEESKYRKFYVVEQGGLNILQVPTKAKALARRHGLDVLIVDYIGLMSGLDSKQARAYQIEEMSRNFKSLAKEMDIVILCLAQVNRGAMDKGNTPPNLHDLRDSGSLEQDADVAMFIHRPIQSQPELGADFERYAVLRIAKNRQGATADLSLFYEPERTFFGEWEGQPPSTKTKTRGGDL